MSASASASATPALDNHLRMTDIVPNRRLEDIYSEETFSKEEVRWNGLAAHFERMFHRKPEFIARAPGRLNMIGEYVRHVCVPLLTVARTGTLTTSGMMFSPWRSKKTS